MRARIRDWVQPGAVSRGRAIARYALRQLLLARSLTAPAYRPPDAEELVHIEHELAAAGMPCGDFRIEPDDFQTFKRLIRFPPEYHGGLVGGVYNEKLLEHFVAWNLLGLGQPGSSPYVDIAACASPWAKLLRSHGIEAYAIDLAIDAEFANLDYYRCEDATRSHFSGASMGGASLQCAYEMFTGDQDMALLTELGRILRPGGRAVISPLYTHTHACHYQTPEYFGRFPGDPGAKAYVRRDCWGVPSSRKYDAQTLRRRVWDNALRAGLMPSLKVLRNKQELGEGIYLHFILILDKPLSIGQEILEAV